MRYTTKPEIGLIIFHFRVINITKFLLENIQIEL